MNRKRWTVVLIMISAAAALCAAGLAVRGGLYMTAVTFPIKQIGKVLRVMSLSGTAGNAAATALYAVICLTPIVWLVLSVRKRGFAVEDLFKPALSALLFPAIQYTPACMREKTCRDRRRDASVADVAAVRACNAARRLASARTQTVSR